jgi:hypothetical protein
LATNYSGNPFYFFFKNKKIETESGTRAKRTDEANSSKKKAAIITITAFVLKPFVDINNMICIRLLRSSQ